MRKWKEIQKMLWQIILFILSICCLAYYILIRIYTKRRNSTFLLFWLLSGLALLALSFLLPVLPETVCRYLIVAATVFVCCFLVVEGLICSAMLKKAEDGLEYIIVLGAQVRGTRITNSLERRLIQALRYLEDNPDARAIVSGGQGKGEDIPEAAAMAAYLSEHGVESERIILEDKSTTTQENLSFSAAFIPDRKGRIGLVTNDFHMYRALMIAKSLGYQNIRGIAASSNPVLQANYLVREFFACIYYWLRLCLRIFQTKMFDK